MMFLCTGRDSFHPTLKACFTPRCALGPRLYWLPACLYPYCMPQPISASAIPGYRPGKKTLLIFFETDCPTCQLALPYFNALASDSVQVIALSQDDEARTGEFVKQMAITYRVELDRGLRLSGAYDPQSVPATFLLNEKGEVTRSLIGFDKVGLNDLA